MDVDRSKNVKNDQPITAAKVVSLLGVKVSVWMVYLTNL